MRRCQDVGESEIRFIFRYWLLIKQNNILNELWSIKIQQIKMLKKNIGRSKNELINQIEDKQNLFQRTRGSRQPRKSSPQNEIVKCVYYPLQMAENKLKRSKSTAVIQEVKNFQVDKISIIPKIKQIQLIYQAENQNLKQHNAYLISQVRKLQQLVRRYHYLSSKSKDQINSLQHRCRIYNDQINQLTFSPSHPYFDQINQQKFTVLDSEIESDNSFN